MESVVSQVAAMAGQPRNDEASGTFRYEVLLGLQRLRFDLDMINIARDFVLEKKTEVRARSIARMGKGGTARYTLAARELLRLWRELTGRPASFPKNRPRKMHNRGYDKAEAEQRSTAFVQVGLSIAANVPGSRIPLRQTMTAIRGARELDKQIGAFSTRIIARDGASPRGLLFAAMDLPDMDSRQSTRRPQPDEWQPFASHVLPKSTRT